MVQSIVRAALAGDQAALGKQVARLRERLEKAGAAKEAATLGRLLDAVEEARELAPSRVEVSRSLVMGERLTPTVHPPIDRETGARLCSIDFVGDGSAAPIYGPTIRGTIEGLLQEWGSDAAVRSVGA